MVGEGLLRFDRERYFITDFVVMPNHVHYLAGFAEEDAFLKQNTDWKRFMAREINRRVGDKGEFWQVDQFDHLVRSEAQFLRLRGYIKNNPIRAGLPTGEFLWFSKDL